MKLATYNPQVKLNNINGQVHAYGDGGAAQTAAAIGQMQGRSLQGLGAAINFAGEQLDSVNVQAASNEYTKRLNDLLYNPDNGLMNTKMQQAEGIAARFEEEERKIRQEVGQQYKFMTGKGTLVFNRMTENSAAQRYELVRRHQTQQYNDYRDVTFNNAIDEKLYKFYQNPELFSDSLDSIMRLVTGLTKEKAVKYADAEENDRLKVMLNELNACENFDEQCSLWCNWTNSLNSVDENVWILAVGKKLMDSGHYSPLINKIWFIFRALCQSEYFGMSRTSVIPSDYYNTYRQKCYKACLKRIEQHPDDKVAMACALSIAGRANVIRFGENYFGNDAMIEAVMLMPGRYEYLNEGVDGEEEGLDEDSDETMEQIE